MRPHVRRLLAVVAAMAVGCPPLLPALAITVAGSGSNSLTVGGHDASGAALDGRFHGSPGWLDPVTATLESASLTADADFREHATGAVYEMTTMAGISGGLAAPPSALWADTWYTFELLAETAYTITGSFQGSLDPGSGGTAQALLSAALYTVSGASLYSETDHALAAGSPLVFNFPLDGSGAATGPRSGTLRLGAPGATPVPEASPSLLLLALGLVGLMTLRRASR